jgi:hypothetical protein
MAAIPSCLVFSFGARMGAKSRPLGHFTVTACFRRCKHKDNKNICDNCWHADKQEPDEKGQHDSGKV